MVILCLILTLAYQFILWDNKIAYIGLSYYQILYKMTQKSYETVKYVERWTLFITLNISIETKFCCHLVVLGEVKWNERGFRSPLYMYAKLSQEDLLRMVRWIRWHCPLDTGFGIRTLAVWDRARYISVTEVPHNIESSRVSGEETFCFFETWRPERSSSPRSPTFQAGSFNHCTRAPAL